MFSKKKPDSIKMSRVNTTISGNYNEGSDKDQRETDKCLVSKNDSVTFQTLRGSFYIFFHVIFNKLASVIIQKLPYVNPYQLFLIRNIAIFPGIFPLTIFYTRQIFGEKKDRLALLLRGSFVASGVLLEIIGYSYIPLTEATIIMSTLPVVTAVLARIILKEPYGWVQRITLGMTVCGVLLSLRIPKLLQNRNSVSFNSTYIAGLVASAASVLVNSLGAVYICKLKNVHFTTLLFYTSVVGITESSLLIDVLIPFSLPYCGSDQILCILFGIFCFIESSFFVCAFQVESAGLAAVLIVSFEILITILFEIIFLNLYPDLYVSCGACLVTSSISILGVRNWILLQPESSKFKESVKWLL